jgi:hypothetical protein
MKGVKKKDPKLPAGMNSVTHVKRTGSTVQGIDLIGYFCMLTPDKFFWPKEDIIEEIKFVARCWKGSFSQQIQSFALTHAGDENDVHQVLTSWQRSIGLTAERNVMNLRIRLEYFRTSCLVNAALV